MLKPRRAFVQPARLQAGDKAAPSSMRYLILALLFLGIGAVQSFGQTLTSIVVAPTTVVGGTGSTGTVTLSTVAPAGGTVVSLISNNGAATVPASVTVAAGVTTGSFPVTTTVVTANVSPVLTATLAATQKTATLTVTPLLATLTLSQTSVIGGFGGTGTVTLNAVAPVGAFLLRAV